jgi:DNA-binding transcriptional regulator GbsR (MarR family)
MPEKDETDQRGDSEQENGDSEGESDDIEQARGEVIEALARSAEVYGAKRSYGKLYGILFFADEPLSLDELVERSDYAKSTVSTAMNTLERFHMAHRRSLPGEGKKAFYEAETDFWYIFQQFLQQEVRREIDIMTRALDSAITTLEEAETEQATRDLEKLRNLRRVYQRSERLVNLVTSQPVDRLSSMAQKLTGGDR